MRTRAAVGLVTAIGLTAAFTYLLVANHYQRQQLAILRSELGRVEAERVALQEELFQTQEQLRSARTPPSSSTKSRSAPAPQPGPAPRPVRQAPAPPPPPQPADPLQPVASPPEETWAPVVGVYPALPAGGWISYLGCPTGAVCQIEGQATAGRGTVPWRVEGRLIHGRFEVDARWNLEHVPASLTALVGSNVAARAEVSIPIHSLKSQATAGAAAMEKRLQQALNARFYPNLYYRLGSLALAPMPDDQPRQWLFASQGHLAINGVTNDWDWQGYIEPIGPGRLKITVQQPIRLSAFRIVAPRDVVAGQAVQVHDVVSAYLSWVVAREEPNATGR